MVFGDLESKERKYWVDEDGRNVEFISLFNTLYRDEGTRELDEKYDVKTCRRFVGSSLGKTELEVCTGRLLSICKAVDYFVGFEKNELEEYESIVGGHVPSDYMRVKKIGQGRKGEKGIEVLFPTEELLENQKVKKRD